MFVGYQKDKIVFAANTRIEVENAFGVYFDRIEETDINYVLYDGKYLTPVEVEEKQKQERILVLKAELQDTDAQTIRPLRAKLAGTSTEVDEEKLTELEYRAQQLRAEIAELSV